MSELSQIQKKLLEMIKKLHEYCIKNSIRYYAIGGTMLGAARHKGFIPWDDDIDIGMPRPDYDRFISQIKVQPICGCFVESSDSSDPAFLFPYAKLYDTSTTLIENTRRPLKRGVYIDIFPLDGLGNNPKVAEKEFSTIKRRKDLLTMRVMSRDKKRSLYKRITLVAIQTVPACILNEKRLVKKIESLCRQREYDESAFVGNLVGAWGRKEIVPREFFGTPVEYEFENHTIMGVEMPEEYLAHIYGAWRELPPLDKQVSHHSYIVDFTKSYLDE